MNTAGAGDRSLLVSEVAGHPCDDLVAVLAELAHTHALRDGSFTAPCWLVHEPGWLRLLAYEADHRPVGFLAGRPEIGHIALVGVTTPRHGIGARLVSVFAEHARRVEAPRLTVVLDSEPHRRWQRRRFFESLGFEPAAGSALHFARHPA